MDPLLAGLVIGGLILLIVLLFTLGKKKPPARQTHRSVAQSPTRAGTRPCPLCKSPLMSGQRIYSVVFGRKKDQDKIMEISGCPYCFPGHPKGPLEPRAIAYCPVCKKPLQEGQVVTARVFARTGKDHIHVLGCPNCRKK